MGVVVEARGTEVHSFETHERISVDERVVDVDVFTRFGCVGDCVLDAVEECVVLQGPFG